MAEWLEVSNEEFSTYLREQRAKQEVFTHIIQAKNMRIHYIGDRDWRSPRAVWVAKVERIGNDQYFFII